MIVNYNSFSQSKYDELLAKTEMVKQSEMIVEQMLEYYAKQRPTIPNNVWKEVKDDIKYTSFVPEVKEVFEKYYTLEEVTILIEMIDNYGLKAYKPKPEVTQELYIIGKDLGKDIGNQINIKLKQFGY